MKLPQSKSKVGTAVGNVIAVAIGILVLALIVKAIMLVFGVK